MEPMTYILLVAASFAAKYLTMWLDRYIVWHSDGGGWDAGSAYSFDPDAMLHECLWADDMTYPGMGPYNPRVRALVWCFNLVPGYVLFHLALFLVLDVPCLLKYFFTYGARDPRRGA